MRRVLVHGCLALVFGLAGPAWAAPPPAPLVEVLERALDHPLAAAALAREKLTAAEGAGDRDAVFWLRLALVDVLVQSDLETQARAELARARAAAPDGDAGRRHRLWLDQYSALLPDTPIELTAFRAQQAVRRAEARALDDPHALCGADLADAVVYNDHDETDEAWKALEATERCARETGHLGLQSYALGTMGLLASRISSQLAPESFYERALRALGNQPARFKRAWLLDDLGWAQLNRGDLEAARRSFEQVLTLSLEIGDVAGAMQGHEGLAEVLLKQGDATATLRHAREALRLGTTEGLRFRQVTAQTQVVEALAALRRPELVAEVEKLLGMAALDPTPHVQTLIAKSAARGLRAAGQYARAYEQLERYLDLARIEDKARRDLDAQRLQARYEAMRRDAELSELRYAAEAARLELTARTERQRALIAALLAVLMVMAGGAWFFSRALARRRRLAELALRDELTGLPNRRAVLAFAREQFGLARRLDVPFSVALIDLDRFKLVNDTHGHAAGDRVLQAFAQAAARILRGQDRIGRWGGEEWLLVMPGTRADEFAPLFTRLRAALAELPIPGLPVPHGITFSMGGAMLRPEIENLDALIAEADRRLYEAKAQGRDAVRSCADPTLAVAG